ncbi:MAG: bifunctional riboflavin kinase/FAD synthetase [Dehalococcoidales bacterium]|nr:bifunctional riboflavin kinase/FAD synthetase [Dehalococcoidales bacterium]
MLVEEELASFSPEKDTIVTVGVFDGVHLGHKELISEVLQQAGEKGMLAAVVTFCQHPEDLLSSKKQLPYLTDIQTRVRLLQNEGVDIIVPLTFDKELAGLDAEVFVGLLQKYLRMRGLVIGSDFALGKGRKGDTDALRRLGEAKGFGVTVVPPLEIDGEVVSSTTIRKAMAEGDMRKVHRLTGKYFSLHGKVVTGAGRGEGLGFPTANLDVNSGQALPPDGVYAGIAHINGRTYQTMTNVGKDPTFGRNERTIESYLLDYSGDLYGHELRVDFVAKLRDEKKFAGPEDLQRQVTEDIRQGKSILESMRVN